MNGVLPAALAETVLVTYRDVKSGGTAGNPVAHLLYTWRWSIVALWYTAVILMILVRFWNYLSTLI